MPTSIEGSIGVDKVVEQEIKDKLNAPGSAPVFGCRAWVSFDGESGGVATIKASGNISSVVKDSEGLYTITFTTPMPDANYCITCTSSPTTFSDSANRHIAIKAISSTDFQIRSQTVSGSDTDVTLACVAVFR